jgi:WD40 repeat protein
MRPLLIIVLYIFTLFIPGSFAQQKPVVDEAYELYLTQIAAAEAFLHLNKISTANSYLDACSEKYRGLEWHFLRAALDNSKGNIAKRDGVTVADVKISPDGRMAASAASDSIIILYSLPGFQKIRELNGHNGSVTTLDFSSDSRRLVSGGRDHAVILWDLGSGKQIARNNTSFTQGIYQVRFNPANSMIGVVSWERLKDRPPHIFGIVKLLDGGSVNELKRIELDNHPAAGIVFTPDGQDMIISTWGEVTYSYNVSSGNLNWKYDLSDPSDYNAFHSIGINPAGDRLALGSTDRSVHILNVNDGKLVHKIEPWVGHSKIIKAVSFSPYGNWLATAGEDQTILIWDTKDYSRKHSLKGHINAVNALCWTKDEQSILSSSMDGSVKIWNLTSLFENTYDVCDFGPWQTPLSADSKYFAAPCSDKKLILYNSLSGEAIKNLGTQSGLCAVISKDSKFLISSSFDGIVRLWNLDSSKQMQSFTGHTARVDGVAYKDDTQEILSVGDSTLRVWNIRSGKISRLIKFNAAPFRIVLNPGGALAFLGFNSGLVKVIDTRSWSELDSFTCSAGIQEVTMSPDGKQFAAFCSSSIEIWETATFTRNAVLKGHQKSGYGLDFSRDGKYLISGSHDQTFKLWNLETGRAALTYHGIEDNIYNCKFLSNRKIFLSSSEGKVWIYEF